MGNNYMEALLRAALLLGDLPVQEITISGFLIRSHVRKLYPRCKMVAQMKQPVYPVETVLISSIQYGKPSFFNFSGTAYKLLSLFSTILLQSRNI